MVRSKKSHKISIVAGLVIYSKAAVMPRSSLNPQEKESHQGSKKTRKGECVNLLVCKTRCLITVHWSKKFKVLQRWQLLWPRGQNKIFFLHLHFSMEWIYRVLIRRKRKFSKFLNIRYLIDVTIIKSDYISKPIRV